MDYEKKYKDAMGMAEKIIRYYKEHNRGDETSIEDLEQIFPELKESEDEMIRKELIRETKGSEERLFEAVIQKHINMEIRHSCLIKENIRENEIANKNDYYLEVNYDAYDGNGNNDHYQWQVREFEIKEE